MYKYIYIYISQLCNVYDIYFQKRYFHTLCVLNFDKNLIINIILISIIHQIYYFIKKVNYGIKKKSKNIFNPNNFIDF